MSRWSMLQHQRDATNNAPYEIGFVDLPVSSVTRDCRAYLRVSTHRLSRQALRASISTHDEDLVTRQNSLQREM
jgi:hypothetical protein